MSNTKTKSSGLMDIQLELKDSNKKKSLIYVKAEDCVISKFNTRKTRNKGDIADLTERIERNGFEVTRALWGYEEGGKYQIFAGGYRLKAVKRTSYKDNIPLVLHEGYSDREIAQLETQDNENDEYHKEVPIVDVWAEYARLKHIEKWTQQEIAQVKGVNRSLVSERLSFDKFPREIKQIVERGYITETHLRKILGISSARHFPEWVTTNELRISIAKWSEHRATNETKEEVDRWKEIISVAKNYYEQLPETDIKRKYETEDGKEVCIETEYNPKEDFVERLAEREPDTKRKVQNIINRIEDEQLEASKEYEAFLKRQADEAEAERQRQEERERERQEREFFYPKIFCQSSEDMNGTLIDIDDAEYIIEDESIALVVTSPPYNIGKQYDKHDDKQDWNTYRNNLLKPVFEQCYKKLIPGGRIAVNVPNVACQEGEKPIFILFDVFRILQECGFEDREVLTWVKADVGDNFQDRMDALAFDTTAWGSWQSPSNPVMRSLSEFVIVMHKTTPKLECEENDLFSTKTDLTEDEFKSWTRNVWFIPPVSSGVHPSVFPEELPKRLIKLYSYPTQIILDPFMGIGTTGIAAIKNNRRFIGFDISEGYCREAINAIANLDLFEQSSDN